MTCSGGSVALRHLERCDGVAVAIDDGEAALQRDLVLAKDLDARSDALQTIASWIAVSC